MASGETIDDVVRKLVNILDAAGIPYMLTGSFASSLHGMPRATQDIDLVIAPNPQSRIAKISVSARPSWPLP